MPPPPPIGLTLSSLVSYPPFSKPSPAAPMTLHLNAAGLPPATTRVEYTADTVMGTLAIGSATAAPWAVDWTTTWVGAVTIRAVGRDASGAVIAGVPGATLTITAP